MAISNTVDRTVQAPASDLWKYVREYGKIHKYVDFIDDTAMDDVEPDVGVLRVVHEGRKHLDETITVWDEKNKSYSFEIQNGPPFAKTIMCTLSVKDIDQSTSHLAMNIEVELKTFFSYILPSFILKKKLGGVQTEIVEGYKKAAETNMSV